MKLNTDESEAERNMRIARSVLDEETALDMARTFIKLTKVRTMTKKTPKTKTSRKTESATNKKAKGQDNDHGKDKKSTKKSMKMQGQRQKKYKGNDKDKGSRYDVGFRQIDRGALCNRRLSSEY